MRVGKCNTTEIFLHALEGFICATLQQLPTYFSKGGKPAEVGSSNPVGRAKTGAAGS